MLTYDCTASGTVMDSTVAARGCLPAQGAAEASAAGSSGAAAAPALYLWPTNALAQPGLAPFGNYQPPVGSQPATGATFRSPGDPPVAAAAPFVFASPRQAALPAGGLQIATAAAGASAAAGGVGGDAGAPSQPLPVQQSSGGGALADAPCGADGPLPPKRSKHAEGESRLRRLPACVLRVRHLHCAPCRGLPVALPAAGCSALCS